MATPTTTSPTSDLSGTMDAPPSNRSPTHPNQSGTFRTRQLDPAAANIVEAEFSALLNLSSSSSTHSMVPRVSEMYPRLLLKHRHGYPLFFPEPKRGISMEYRKKGIKIGDVGRITPDGAFDFLFNVDSSRAHLVNPALLPKDFETIPPVEFSSGAYFQPGDYLLSDHVTQATDMSSFYKFSEAEGAVLQVPEGATIFEAKNMDDLHDLASRHAPNWYEYMLANRSREIPNGSLYLVTGCVKARSWGIGTIYAQPTETDYLEFTSSPSSDQSSRPTYGWRRCGPITTRIGPTSADIVVTDDEEPNQCIFIRGYKIALGKKLWRTLKKRAGSMTAMLLVNDLGSPSSSRSLSEGDAFQRSATGGLSPGHSTHSLITEDSEGGPEFDDPDDIDPSLFDSEEIGFEGVLLERLFSVESPMHPADFVHVMFMHTEPESNVILVHDDDWRSSLPDDFAANPQNLKINDFIKNIARSYLALVKENGSVSLISRTAPNDALIEREVVVADFECLESAQTSVCRQPIGNQDSVITEQDIGFEPHPNQRAVTAISDKGIPMELIVEILNYLNLSSMLRCREVCPIFRDIVDSLPTFHWQIELAIAGKRDGGHYPLATRRNMLQQNQRGWTNLKWSKETRFQFTGSRWRFAKNIFAQDSLNSSVMRIKQLPSQSRGIEEKNWTVNIEDVGMRDFSLDPRQDLLVIISQSHWGWDCLIYILTLSTGDPHPLVMNSHTLIRPLEHGQMLPEKPSDIQICGDILCILFKNHRSNETEFVFWNWKTGRLLADILSDGATDMTFLSQCHVIFGLLPTPGDPKLVVVDFIAQPSERQRLQNSEHIFTFCFPPLVQSAQVVAITIESDPMPADDLGLATPFFSGGHSLLHIVTLLVETCRGQVQVQFYVLGDSFLSLVKEGANQSSISFEWDTWGPEGSRMMISQFPHAQMGWTSSPCGMIYVSTKESRTRPVDRIYIHDFNQVALRWHLKNCENERIISDSETIPENARGKREGNSAIPSPYVAITTPTQIVDGDIFQGEVETRLKYRLRSWTIPGEPRVRFPACIEDGIILVDEWSDFRVLTV